MSNGSNVNSRFSFKQDEGAYDVAVGEAWSSAETWVTVQIDCDGKQVCRWDLDNDQARELAAMLLESAGNQDLAAAIPADVARRQEAARVRRDASEKLRNAAAAAKKAFFDATAEQREAFNAAIDHAEDAYSETAGERVYRSIVVDDNDDPWAKNPS